MTAEDTNGVGHGFDLGRWVGEVLPLNGIVHRLALIASGLLFDRSGRGVTAEHVSTVLGLSESVVADVLNDAVTEGLVTRSSSGARFSPAQGTVERSAEDRKLAELAIRIDCETCLAVVRQPCITARKTTAWTAHQPRRDFAAGLVSEQGRAA